MSDDEGEDYGDYEDLGIGDEPLGEEGLAEPDPELEADIDGDDVVLEEDAAGTEDEDDSDDEPGDDDAEPVEPVMQKARPERQKTDPVLRMSKPRFVHVVAPEDRVTDSRLQTAEASYIIAMRSEQISKHATCFTEGGAIHDPVVLAFKELLDRRCPFILRRQIGTTPGGEPIVEEWVVRDMTLPPLTPPISLGGGRAFTAARATPIGTKL